MLFSCRSVFLFQFGTRDSPIYLEPATVLPPLGHVLCQGNRITQTFASDLFGKFYGFFAGQNRAYSCPEWSNLDRKPPAKRCSRIPGMGTVVEAGIEGIMGTANRPLVHPSLLEISRGGQKTTRQNRPDTPFPRLCKVADVMGDPRGEGTLWLRARHERRPKTCR
jgi:hypothetical protein